MKGLLIAVTMLLPVVGAAQAKAAKEFPLTVHVVSSRIEMVPGDKSSSVSGVNLLDLLHVKAEGRVYLLAVPLWKGIFARMAPVLIEPGRYSARIIKNETPNPGEVMRTYQLRLRNGKRVKALLWGVEQ